MSAKVLQRLDILLFANTAQYRSEMRDTQQSTTTMMGAIKADAANMAKVGAAAFAGMAAAGTVAIGAMIQEQIELGTEMTRLSRIANTSVEDMQKLAFAAKAVGVEQDTLGDIYKDTQDKIGDFLSSGGGAMADYFENVAPLIGQTAEEFRTLSGPEALQKYYDGLQQANLSQSEMVFYLEGIASDASALIPLLHDSGAGFDVWATAAENAGAVMSAKTITATQELQASTDLMMLSYDGAKKQFTQALIPVLSDVAGQLVSSGNAADFAREAGDKLVQTVKFLAKAGTVVATVFKTVGTVIGGTAATVSTLLDGVLLTDGGIATAIRIARNASAAGNVIRDISFDTKQIWEEASTNFARIDALGTGPTNKFVSTVMAQNMAQQELNRTLGITGQQYQAQLTAADEAAKAAEKAANASKKAAAAAAKNIQAQAVNSKVLAQAKQYNYGNLEKEYGLPAGLLSAVSMQESRGNANARSPVGASGAFQFMPGTADRFGIRGQESNVGKSAEAAAKYLSFLMNKFGSVDLALAGYNAGEGNVAKYGNKIPPFKETQEYVKKVNGYLAFMKGGLDGSVNIAGNIASQTAIIEREAAEQVRILEQQAKDRVAIRLEYSDEATRIEEQLKTKILQISASGFSDNERDAFIADAIDIANEKLAQMQLVHDQEMQYAQQAEQTDAERIRNQYALERREIQTTLNMDEQLRTAKIDALNQAEQLALDERRYAYERELRDLTSIGQSSLASLRQTYADQRRSLDQRTDIDDDQKSSLRNAMAGAQIYDTNQLQTAARDPFNAQQADISGMGANYGLAQQYQGRLDVIQEALDAEVIAVEQAEQAKYAARYEFEAAATQLTLSQAEATAGGLAASFKTMLGEQNTAYKLLFAGQQAFVMASAGLNMWDAYGDAMAEGATMSQKFAAAATIATEFGRIITAASSMTLELPGYRDGGYTGDAPEDQIVGYVHGREHVSDAATTKRYRPELEAMSNGTYERQGNSAAPNVNVSVTVTMEGNSSVESESQYGKQIGQSLAAVVVNEVTKMTRPNGKLDRLYAKR
ncbi:transglycosylase SLT domain-containing protein [Psychrobacter sp.]|uniref:lytic transglycosylase domain-containing protein n=1 Tax=Psychrobacter sp. TaxID=56811 RepID=UPI003C739582